MTSAASGNDLAEGLGRAVTPGRKPERRGSSGIHYEECASRDSILIPTPRARDAGPPDGRQQAAAGPPTSWSARPTSACRPSWTRPTTRRGWTRARTAGRWGFILPFYPPPPFSKSTPNTSEPQVEAFALVRLAGHLQPQLRPLLLEVTLQRLVVVTPVAQHLLQPRVLLSRHLLQQPRGGATVGDVGRRGLRLTAQLLNLTDVSQVRRGPSGAGPRGRRWAVAGPAVGRDNGACGCPRGREDS